jgi:hypothetical protein
MDNPEKLATLATNNRELYRQCDLVVQISNLPLLVRFFIGFWNCSDDVTFFSYS